MLYWPTDYQPVFDLPSNTDIDEMQYEPFDTPAEAAVNSWHLGRMADIAAHQRNRYHDDDHDVAATYAQYMVTTLTKKAIERARFAARYLTELPDKECLRRIVADINATFTDAHGDPDAEYPEDIDQEINIIIINTDLEIRTRAVIDARDHLHHPPEHLALSTNIADAWNQGTIASLMEGLTPDYHARPDVHHVPSCCHALSRLYHAAASTIEANPTLLKCSATINMEQYPTITHELANQHMEPQSVMVAFQANPDDDADADIFIAYYYNGVRIIQSSAEPFPPGTPAYLARYAADAVTHHLKVHTEQEPNDPSTPIYWAILHQLHAAISVDVHTVNRFDLDELTYTIEPKPAQPSGAHHYAAQCLALGNDLAARFLTRSYMLPTGTDPTSDQANAIIFAGRKAGMDRYHLSALARAMYVEPGQLHIKQTDLNRIQRMHLAEAEPEAVPTVNWKYFTNCMDNPNTGVL